MSGGALWLLNHPAAAYLGIPTGCGAVGALLGVTTAYLTVATHVISPDNLVAGASFGGGGVLLGLLAALLIVLRLSRVPEGR